MGRKSRKDDYGGGVQVGATYKLLQTEASALRVGDTLSWADSPITQRKASVYGGIGLGYSF